MPHALALHRRALVGSIVGAAPFTGVCATTPAIAAGGGETICDLGIGDAGLRQHGGGTFDSAIGDGLVVAIGDAVALDPFTGKLELTEFEGILIENGVTSVEGDGVLTVLVAESGERLEIPAHVGPATIGQGQPFAPAVTGRAGTLTPTGTHTLLAQGYELTLVTDPAGPDATVTCDSLDDPAESFDSFVATAAANPTESPVRPVLVQTDFAEDEGAPALPFGAGVGLLALGAGLVGARRFGRRAASRRH